MPLSQLPMTYLAGIQREQAPLSPHHNVGREVELDRMILNTAILNGALEIMPHTLATMAIIPVQMRMVYQIGKRQGYPHLPA